MLLTLTTTHQPATDLGFLLRKHPDRVQSFTLSFGVAHVFYPEATPERCTVALLVEVDPVGLVRNRRGPAGEGVALAPYVNDRPYVASSFLSVALAEVFGSALSGKAREANELVDTPIPLQAELSSVPCRAGGAWLARLFAPLGYIVAATPRPLEERFPDWGESPYYRLRLEGVVPLRRLLTHLYVLIPVLDNAKHYWVGDDEVEKLLRHGEGWLAQHPERDLITRRYLKHRRSLVAEALARLTEDEPDLETEDNDEVRAGGEAALEGALPGASPTRAPASAAALETIETPSTEPELSLNEQRLGTVLAALKQTGARRVLDLGCGEGRLLRALLGERQFESIVGLEVSHRCLEMARERWKLDRLPAKQQARIQLLHGSLIYRDQRLAGFDAAAVVEVIEHLDPPRLAAFERVLFEFARPGHVLITTPNTEYNVKWDTLPAGRLRHHDHRFEWTRAEFQAWARRVAERFGYTVRFAPIGPEDPRVGSPTQMGLFSRPA